MNLAIMQFQALIEKQILDDRGNVVIRTTEKKPNINVEIKNLKGRKLEELPCGAVAGAETPHLRVTVYDLNAFGENGRDFPVVTRTDYDTASA